jgi:hypothetical protein
MTTIVFDNYTYKASGDDEKTIVVVKNNNTREFYQGIYTPTQTYSSSCGGSYVNFKQVVASSKTIVTKIIKDSNTSLAIQISYNSEFHFNCELYPIKCDVTKLQLFACANIDNYFQSISQNINNLLQCFNGKYDDIVFEEDVPQITFEEIEHKFEEIAFVSLEKAKDIPQLAKYYDLVELIRNTCANQQKEVDAKISLEIDDIKKRIEKFITETDNFIASFLLHRQITYTYPQFEFVDGKISFIHANKREIKWNKTNMLKLIATHRNEYKGYGMILGEYTYMLTNEYYINCQIVRPTNNDIIARVYENFAKINSSFTPETITKLFPPMRSEKLGYLVLYIDCTKPLTMEQQFVIDALDVALGNWTKPNQIIP